jgi:hypothetical protein
LPCRAATDARTEHLRVHGHCDATAVATVVAKNRTLSALIFGDGMGEPATLEVGMTEADFSNKNLGMGEVPSLSQRG